MNSLATLLRALKYTTSFFSISLGELTFYLLQLKGSIFDAHRPPLQFMATRQINQTMQTTDLLYGLASCLEAVLLS